MGEKSDRGLEGQRGYKGSHLILWTIEVDLAEASIENSHASSVQFIEVALHDIHKYCYHREEHFFFNTSIKYNVDTVCCH